MRRSKKSARSRTTGAWFTYAGLVSVVGLIVLGFSGKFPAGLETGTTAREPSPARHALKASPSSRPANLPSRIQSSRPASAGPSHQPALPPGSTFPATRSTDRSLTVIGKDGKTVAEIQGNLPKIRREMQQSGMGTKPVRAGSGPAADTENKIPVCDPKPVMTDEEIAACRGGAERAAGE